jgi:hypothetical protein
LRPLPYRDLQAQFQAAMRLPAALARFLVQLQADGRSPHTVAQYARPVRRFGVWLEAEDLPDAVAALEPVARFLPTILRGSFPGEVGGKPACLLSTPCVECALVTRDRR